MPQPRRLRAIPTAAAAPDRKSTRLNSSHSQISYAVFCLKKKKTALTLHEKIADLGLVAAGATFDVSHGDLEIAKVSIEQVRAHGPERSRLQQLACVRCD